MAVISATAPAGRLRAVKDFARDRWFSIDLRTLGLFRIAFGVFLIGGLLDHARSGNLATFFSNQGVLTNHFALFAPIQPRCWSLLFAFSEPGEVAVAFALIFVVFGLFTLGWKTKLMQILVIVCHVSLINRNLLLQDGGAFVTTVLAVWTVFLPLGARFSLDQRRCRRRTSPGGGGTATTAPERYVSFVCLALLLQLTAIYVFNALNKGGATWRDGSAVHYILWQNRMNTGLAAFLRFHEPGWMSPFLTRATLVFEILAGFLVMTPALQTWARRALIFQMWCFHLGIAALLSIGPFSYVMLTYSLLLLGPRDWDLMESWWRRWRPRLAGTRPAAALARLSAEARRLLAPVLASAPGPGRDAVDAAAPFDVPVSSTVSPPVSPPVSRFRRSGRIGAEVLAVFLFVTMIPELTLANPCIPERFKMHDRPEWMGAVLHYLRVYQAWSMFSADPPLEDGIVVVDAVLADGSHFDPLTGREPDFEALAHGPWHLGHDWSEYMSYMPFERHRIHHNGLLQYVLGLHERRERAPERKIRLVNIIWLTGASPLPGQFTYRDIKRQVLVSHVVPVP